MKKEELENKFYEKVENEYNCFIKELLQDKPENIINKAYEITTKEIIKDKLQENEYEKRELKALLQCNKILDECYDEWIDTDANFGDAVEYAIDNRVENIIEEYENVA